MNWCVECLVKNTVLISLAALAVVGYGGATVVGVENLTISGEAFDSEKNHLGVSNQSANPTEADNTSHKNLSNLTDSQRRIFYIGYNAGLEKGKEMGYGEGFVKGSEGDSGGSGYVLDAQVSAPKDEIEMDGYVFLFGDLPANYSGMSWPANDTIKLDFSKIGTADALESICDHEMAHQFFPDFEHSDKETEEDPLYRYSDDMEIKLCDALARRAESG
jgi:hypothetical protein